MGTERGWANSICPDEGLPAAAVLAKYDGFWIPKNDKLVRTRPRMARRSRRIGVELGK